MLQDKVGKITGFVQPPGMNFTFACHQATLYWLYREAFGSAPDVYAYIETSMNGSHPMLRERAGSAYRSIAPPWGISCRRQAPS